MSVVREPFKDVLEDLDCVEAGDRDCVHLADYSKLAVDYYSEVLCLGCREGCRSLCSPLSTPLDYNRAIEEIVSVQGQI